MYVAPQRGHSIEIVFSIVIDQFMTIGCDDHDWIVVEPQLHWCKRMPQVRVVKSLDGVVCNAVFCRV